MQCEVERQVGDEGKGESGGYGQRGQDGDAKPPNANRIWPVWHERGHTSDYGRSHLVRRGVTDLISARPQKNVAGLGSGRPRRPNPAHAGGGAMMILVLARAVDFSGSRDREKQGEGGPEPLSPPKSRQTRCWSTFCGRFFGEFATKSAGPRGAPRAAVCDPRSLLRLPGADICARKVFSACTYDLLWSEPHVFMHW